MNKTALHALFDAVAAAHNAATRVLQANGPGPAYVAAVAAAAALEATLDVACDEYNAASDLLSALRSAEIMIERLRYSVTGSICSDAFDVAEAARAAIARATRGAQ